MENTVYEWTISAMECKIKESTLDNVVTLVHWRLNALRDSKTAETYGVASMPEPSGENFIPYDELTKEQVVDWLLSILDIEEINGRLNADIDLQLNPITETLPPPFSN